MYVKNRAELKQALKTNQPLIQVKDEKFKAKVIKSAMIKGRLYDYNGRRILKESDLKPLTTVGAVAESTMIILAIIGLFAVLGIYALYKKYDIKVVINLDGTLTFIAKKNKYLTLPTHNYGREKLS